MDRFQLCFGVGNERLTDKLDLGNEEEGINSGS